MSQPKFIYKKQGALYKVFIKGTVSNGDIEVHGSASLTEDEARVKCKAAEYIYEANKLCARIAEEKVEVIREAAPALRAINEALWKKSKQDPFMEGKNEVDLTIGQRYRLIEFWRWDT